MWRRIQYIGLFAFIIMCCIFISGCTHSSNTGPAKDVVSANNHFAFDLYSSLREDPQNSDKNLFFSPFSLSSAMAIACEGARGITADEIEAVFHYPTDNEIRRQQFKDLFAGIPGPGTNNTLTITNALWAERSYPFRSDYLQTAGLYYNAKATNLDFINNPEASRSVINQWAANETQDKIIELIPVNKIDLQTRLVITNAVYFNGKWEKSFNPSDTKNDFPFETAPDKTVRVQMMTRGDTFNYTETDALQMVEFPYRKESGTALSMIIILPKNLATLENNLNLQKIEETEGYFTPTKIHVFLPKFRLETDYYLNANLMSMGMPTAFTSTADFSGMDSTGSLQISDVIQKAFVNVNEEGTEAAAASSIRLSQGSDHQPVFLADHPFIFLIEDRETGNILFMGRVMDPNG